MVNFHEQNADLTSGLDCTEEFLGNEEVRAGQMAGANTHGGATKKREISRPSLPINLHFRLQELSSCSCLTALALSGPAWVLLTAISGYSFTLRNLNFSRTEAR